MSFVKSSIGNYMKSSVFTELLQGIQCDYEMSAPEWTEKLYDHIRGIGENNGFNVRCKGSGKEFKHLDFAYFKPNAQSHYQLPEVIIEHENKHQLNDAKSDFFKLCLFDAPLRVMFTYASDETKAALRGDELYAFYKEVGFRQFPNQETLIISGWPQKSGDFRWYTWVINSSQQLQKI